MKQRFSPWLIVKIAVALWIFWFLLTSNLLELHLLGRLFAPSVPLLIMLVSGIALIPLAGLRWYVLLRTQGIHTGIKECLKVTYLGYGLSQFLPGGVGGDVVRLAFVMKHAGHNRAGGITSILADRAIGLASIMLAVVLVFAGFRQEFPDNAHLKLLMNACMVMALGVFIVAVIAVWLPDNLGFSALVSKQVKHQKLSLILIRLAEAIHSYRRAPFSLIGAVALSLVVQVTLSICLSAIATQMGFDLRLWQVLLASSVAQVASLLPITPGGIGVGEAAFTGTLAVFGVPVALGVASVMVGLRCLSILLCVPAYVMYLRSKQ